MKAFHNDPKIKEFYLKRLREHYAADEIVKGVYWENGKGCAVGCTLHSNKHKDFENTLGIPERLAHLDDTIFEGLPNNLAKEWAVRFIDSITVGADLSKVWNKFAIYLLTDSTQCASRDSQCKIVANLHEKEIAGEKIDWSAAAKSAYSSIYSTAHASFASAYAVYAAAYASDYACSRAAYAAAYAAANSAAYIAQSEKLLELLREEKN